MSLAFIALLAISQNPASEAYVVEGKVREVVGIGTSRPTLTTDDGRSLTLKGRTPELHTELRRLSGVRVKLTAAPRAKGTPVGVPVEVERYDILDVGRGKVPRIGHIARLSLEGEARLIFVDERGQADLLPKSWAKRMHRHVGAKLWLLGKKSKKAFHVQRFSILQPGKSAGEDDPKPEKK